MDLCSVASYVLWCFSWQTGSTFHLYELNGCFKGDIHCPEHLCHGSAFVVCGERREESKPEIPEVQHLAHGAAQFRPSASPCRLGHPQGVLSPVAWVGGHLITLSHRLCRMGRAGGEDSQLSLCACAVQVCALRGGGTVAQE